MPDTTTVPQVGSVWTRPHTDKVITVTSVFTMHGRTQVAYDIEDSGASVWGAGVHELDGFLATNVQVKP